MNTVDLIMYAFYEYTHGDFSSKTLASTIRDLLLEREISETEAEQVFLSLSLLDNYFPWDDYFPNVPSSYC